MKPLLKWAGGKQWLSPVLTKLFLTLNSKHVIEPFAGGAALFFSAKPQRATLTDTNDHLVVAYQGLAKNPRAVADILSCWSIDAETYKLIRDQLPDTDVAAAARLIYLNRTAFAGLWRVNKRGEFNVPFGCKPTTTLPDQRTLEAYSTLLRRAKLHSGDFQATLSAITPGDFVYCDPPYTVSHNNNGFLRYNERIFSWSDQRRLASRCNQLASTGHYVVISNAFQPDVVQLYDRKLFLGIALMRPSNLASRARHRRPCRELLLVSRGMWHAQDSNIEELLSRPTYPAEVLW